MVILLNKLILWQNFTPINAAVTRPLGWLMLNWNCAAYPVNLSVPFSVFVLYESCRFRTEQHSLHYGATFEPVFFFYMTREAVVSLLCIYYPMQVPVLLIGPLLTGSAAPVIECMPRGSLFQQLRTGSGIKINDWKSMHPQLLINCVSCL